MSDWYLSFATALDRDRRREQIQAGATAWLLGGTLAFAFTALGLWWHGGYHAAFGTLHPALGHLPAPLWALLSSLGYENLALTGVLVVARRYPRFLWAFFWAALVNLAFTQGLKYGLDLGRPPAVLTDLEVIGPHLTRHAFPSGHTGLAFAIAGCALAFARSPRVRLGWLALAAGVGLSRVAVGVHWPLDVLVGAAGGLASAWVGTVLAQRFSRGPSAAVLLGLMGLLAVFPVRLLLGHSGGFTELDPLLHLLALGGLGAALAGLLDTQERPSGPPSAAGR